MSTSGQGPALIAQNSEEGYRIEGFIDGRVLSIWEFRNPVIMDKFAQAIYQFHTESGVGESIEPLTPMDKDHLGIDIAIDEWGPASIERIAKMRSNLNPETAGHDKILAALNMLESTYLKPGYQDALRAMVPRDNIVFAHNDV